MDNANEQAVIDAFVAAIHAGDRSRTDVIGRRYAQQILDAGWSRWEAVIGGTLLRFSEIPTTLDERVYGVLGVEALEGHVTPERLKELCEEIDEGESLTPEELALWQKLTAESILTENPDGDVYAWWTIRRVTHSDGRVAFLIDLGGGYSFTGPWIE